MHGHNLSGSPKPAPSKQAEVTTRQAAAAAMQIERGRSNPGFSELPSVASSLASNLKQPQPSSTSQPQQDQPVSAPKQQQLTPHQQQALPASIPSQPLTNPTPTSGPSIQPPAVQQVLTAPPYSRPITQHSIRQSVPAFSVPGAMPWPRMPAPVNPWNIRGSTPQQYRPPTIQQQHQFYQPDQQQFLQQPEHQPPHSKPTSSRLPS